MKPFPLHDELIDAVIRFANAVLTDEGEVRQFFNGMWTPDALPALSQCRRIQTETRKWLAEVADGNYCHPAIAAMLGYRPGDTTKSEPGVRFGGALGFLVTCDGPNVRREITWDWWIEKASLRAICGLAVASILHAGLHDRVGLCARDGCGTYFVDRKSRGIRRKFCGRDECDKALNRERVSESRSKRK